MSRELPVWMQKSLVAVVLAGAHVVGFFMRLAEDQSTKGPDQ